MLTKAQWNRLLQTACWELWWEKNIPKPKPTLSPHEQSKCQNCLTFQWNRDSSLLLFTSCSKDHHCCSTLLHTLNNPIEELGTEIFFESLLWDNPHDGIKHQLCPREANWAEPNTPYYPEIPVSLINWMSFPELFPPLLPHHFLQESPPVLLLSSWLQGTQSFCDSYNLRLIYFYYLKQYQK